MYENSIGFIELSSHIVLTIYTGLVTLELGISDTFSSNLNQ